MAKEDDGRLDPLTIAMVVAMVAMMGSMIAGSIWAFVLRKTELEQHRRLASGVPVPPCCRNAQRERG